MICLAERVRQDSLDFLAVLGIQEYPMRLMVRNKKITTTSVTASHQDGLYADYMKVEAAEAATDRRRNCG